MQRTRIQRGGVNLDVSSSGKQIWVFRWRETRPDGRRAPRKRVIGTLEEYPTKKAAENAARGFRLDLVDQGSAALVQITMKELVDHFSEHEQVDKGEEGRAYSTRDRCESVLNCWILPRWGKTAIDQIRTIAVEDWLRSIHRDKGTTTKIRNTTCALYIHGAWLDSTARTPITDPVRGSGVRQSAKRERI